MPVRTARKAHSRLLLRAVPRIGLAAFVLLVGARHIHNAIANGDTRTISFHHLHTGEEITVTFKVNGRYDPAALKKIDWLMRDWRRNESITMEPHLIDLIWEVHRDVGGKGAIRIVCGYRAPATNSMLRRRSSGVAQNSLHTTGKAIDFYIAGANLDDLRAAGLRLQRGGVGFYPGSGWPFVHMDVGSVRHWPRMTYEQLAKVFPDGRTVHVPSNGQPLKNYALALADLEKRASMRNAPAPRTMAVAGLFGFGKAKERDEDELASVPAAPARPIPPAAVAAAPKPAAAPAPLQTAMIPMPRIRPAAPVQTAVAPAAPALSPAKPARPATYTVAAATPNTVIEQRGYWQGQPEAPIESSAARRRNETAAPLATGTIGTIGPWTREQPPGEVAIAYASPYEPKAAAAPARTAPAARAAPAGLAVPRSAAVAAGQTVALKGTPEQPSVVAHASLPKTVTGRAADEPWLRALIATPSVQAYMTTTIYGAPDYRALQPLLAPPAAPVAMSFSADPYQGMSHARFTGPAVVFLASAFAPAQTALR
ncbi:MAG: YcbK family protein [Pseudorhodoplanes sp.]|nr:YcbK family protein [Pseudorhodoplanes sp.]